MNKHLATIMKYFKQIKVVHHVPGRLRLYIPLLERISPEWRHYQSDFVELLKVHEGIIDIEISIITGRILIHYDQNRTSKSQILQWLQDLALAIFEEYVEAPFKSKQQILPFLKKMRSQSRRLMQNNRYVRENG